MNMHYKRSDRIAALIKEEVGQMLLVNMKDPDVGNITVTNVEMTDDLRYAKIYYSVLGDEEKVELAKKALVRSRGFVRSEIGKRIKIRFTPEISLVHDTTAAYADHIEQLLRKIREE